MRDLLNDKGISLDEILLLEPKVEGTEVNIASGFPEMKAMLEGGMSPGEAILPKTKPKNIHQLSFDF